MAGSLDANALFAGVGSGLTAIAGASVGLIEPPEAVCFGAGGALVLTMLAAGSRDVREALDPARLQLARFRRNEQAADVLLVRLPPVPSRTRPRASRGNASAAAASVLRVTDGVAVVPSLRGDEICAVVEADEQARTAIERRLRNTCGGDVRVGWASFPDDGVTLESLITAADGRVHESPATPTRPGPSQLLPGHRLAARSLDPGRLPARRAR